MADQYTEIVKAIVDGDDTQATKLVEAALAQGLPPLDIPEPWRGGRHQPDRRVVGGQQVLPAGRDPFGGCLQGRHAAPRA